MSLDNTKVYTNDPEVIRKYAELCGKELSGFDLSMTSTVGVYNCKTDRFVNDFENGSVADNYFTKITTEQINALYNEKFDIMAQDNEQLQNYEMGNSSEIQDDSEWKNGDECIYCGDVWNFVSILSDEFHGTAVIFDRISEELKQVDLSKIKRPETPEQREERERDEWVQNVIGEMMDSTGLDFTLDGDVQVVKAMYDLGYRKQKDGE